MTSPAAGAVWDMGTTQSVHWSAPTLSGNVKIFLSLDAGPWAAIVTDTPNDGAHDWKVKLGPSSRARVRVTSMASNAVYGESGLFAIQGAAITVDAPTTGTVWENASVQTIRWSAPSVGANVKIYSSPTGAAPWNLIVWDTPNDGSHAWEIHETPSTRTKVRVISMFDNAIFGESGFFTIGPPAITVDAPAAGAVWPKGSTQTIRWSAPTLAGNVKIFVSADAGPWTSIAWDTPNDGSHDWVVNVNPSSRVKVRVTSMSNNQVYAESPLFTVASGETIAVTAPAPGAVWQKGTTQTIQWTSSPGLAGNVKIFVSVASGPWTSIAWHLPNTGSYNWLVNTGPSTQVKIRVSSMQNNTVYGESGLFAID